MRDYSSLQTKLECRALELTERLERIKQDVSREHATDWSEQALERENDEVLNQLAIKAEQESKEINAALSRLENGHYGLCLECGKQIAMGRLSIKPDAKFCTYCAYNR